MSESLRQEPEAKPEALAKTEQAIEKLEPKPPAAIVLASSRVQDVLPQKFYEGASTLELSDKQVEALQEFEDAPAEEWDIRPDGLVYVSHMWYRKALNRIFGPGRWSMMPGSPIQTQTDGNRIHLYQRWVLIVNEHYIGEAIGSSSYWLNNATQDISDAAESAASNAIMRICAKSLGIGSNPWNRREAQKWRKEYAKQVWVQDRRDGRVKRWRRVDADPLPDEIPETPRTQVSRETPTPPRRPQELQVEAPTPSERPEKPQVAGPVPQVAGAKPQVTPTEKKPPTPKPEPLVKVVVRKSPGVLEAEALAEASAALSAKSASESAPAKPTASPAPEKPPEAKSDAKGDLVTEGQVRLFIADARRRQLIRGEDASAAWKLLQDLLPASEEELGKTDMENMLRCLRKQTKQEFSEVILPALREIVNQ